MRRPLFSSLYGRIFAVFWLTLFLVVITLVLLPNLDPRAQHTIPEPQLFKLNQVAARISDRISTMPEELSRKLKPITRHERHDGSRVYFTTLEGEVIAPPRSQ